MSHRKLRFPISLLQINCNNWMRGVFFSLNESNAPTFYVSYNPMEILVDDDQDCIILKVRLTAPGTGGEEASCHVGYKGGSSSGSNRGS